MKAYRAKILVVEDNIMNMKLFRSLLQLNHFEVIEAENGEKGLVMAEQHIPNLILMDIQLPGIDGLTATRKIKMNPKLSHIPIIALTSHAMLGDDKKAHEAGCDGYITKPIDTRHFVDRILAHLPKKDDVIDAKEKLIVDNAKKEKLYLESRYIILVVDDEINNVKLITAMLSSEPYEIFQAFNGEQALSIINNNKIDLILLDVMMPGMNGFELTKLLKNNVETQHIPIILVTALDGIDNKLKALEVGADEFLTKPVKKIEIITRIKSLLQMKQYQEQLNVRVKIGEELAIPEKVLALESQQQDIVINSDQQTVLLVEDDPQYTKFFKSLLEAEPYNFIIASTGEEAIKISQRMNIDLILLDIILPGINGYEVCKYFRSQETLRNLQIIAITSLSDLESKLESINIGVDDYLIKPVNSRELITRINVMLRKKAYLDQLHDHHREVLSLAIIDGLTGLYNHAYFKNYLKMEIERSLKRNYLVALIMLDLDDFKKCNDMLGHPTGDTILRQFSDLIKINIRDIDLPARYGGEEFAIVMPYASKKNALEIAEKIRLSIQDLPIDNERKSTIRNITTSIGIALCPMQSKTVDGLIDKADYMLYNAKKTGKNKVCYWE
jgi:two-component system cell cycle response regulator